MTNRTDYQRSPIEQATADVLADLNSAIAHEHRAHKLHIPEAEFRRIIAGYLDNQKFGDLCEMLGIERKEGDPA